MVVDDDICDVCCCERSDGGGGVEEAKSWEGGEVSGGVGRAVVVAGDVVVVGGGGNMMLIIYDLMSFWFLLCLCDREFDLGIELFASVEIHGRLGLQRRLIVFASVVAPKKDAQRNSTSLGPRTDIDERCEKMCSIWRRVMH